MPDHDPSAGDLSVDAARACALALLDGAPEGPPLDPVTAALVDVGVHLTATTLDTVGGRERIVRALDAGASPAQVHEVLVLVSGIGVHSLMVGSALVADVLRARGATNLDAPLDPARAQRWEQRVGTARFWTEMERELPGFLEALLRQSPEAFDAFFDYCAVPSRTGALAPVTRELVSLAVDATLSHRFLPGLRLHVRTAVRLGAGARQVRDTLDIAAAAPPHRGTRR